MPGKKYKSIGIRDKVYEKIEKEKREGESISDYIDRIIDMGIAVIDYKDKEKEDGKDMVTQPNEATGNVYEAIEALRKDIASFRDGKELVTGGELSDKDIKRMAAEMLLEIGMHIENGIAKGIKDLR